MSGDSYLIKDQHSTYFITCTITNWIDLFSRTEYKDIVVESLKYCIRNKGLVLHAWVIMSNHIHMVCRVDPPNRMSDFLRDFKKFTSISLIKSIKMSPESRKTWMLEKFHLEAKRTGRAKDYKIWKDSNHAVDLANNNIDIFNKIDYIHENPVTAGIVWEPDQYVYSSAIDYAGKKGLIPIELG